jgi:hypothetical protein
MRDRGLETQDNVDIYGDICITFIRSEGGMEEAVATLSVPNQRI